jgi:hypothetical protein
MDALILTATTTVGVALGVALARCAVAGVLRLAFGRESGQASAR